VAIACATVSLALLPVAMPAGAATPVGGHAKTAALKKKCKKKKRSAKRCRRIRGEKTINSPGVPAVQHSAQNPQQDSTPSPGDPVPDACGPRVAKDTGGYWDCTFSDDFNGTSLDGSKWVPQRTDTSGYTSGPTACFVDSPNNISVSDGTLKLTARKESAPLDCAGIFTTRYTSGMVSTALGRFSQTYGRFDVRAKISSAQVKGLHSALWLWPVDSKRYGPFPGSGEIDIAEMYSQYPDRAVPYIHYNEAEPDPSVTNYSCLISNLADFHTYTLEWTASSIKISYDGKTCLVHNWNPASPLVRPQPFDQPFMIALTQALGVASNEFDPATTPLPATTVVDYVRAWK
jgi:beta-glucanase (GH16 family)